jgi:hypothetical protein
MTLCLPSDVGVVLVTEDHNGTLLRLAATGK